MSVASNSKYMESKILTASQPQLHLMLLEGAVRFGHKAVELWGDPEHANTVDQLVTRLLDIVEELSRSTSGRDNEISLRLEEEYAFLFRELAACRLNADRSQLEKCLEILNYQRDTWKQACEQLEFAADTAPKQSANMPSIPLSTPTIASSFSMDA